jgi:hypothetical protein
MVWSSGRFVRIAVIYEDCAGSSTVPGLDVAPSITDHYARPYVETPSISRLEQHARPGLSAPAVVSIVVRADENVRDGQASGDRRVDRLDVGERARTARDVGLIGHDDEHETRGGEPRARILDARESDRVFGAVGWEGSAVPNHGRVEDAVTIEKDASARGVHEARPERASATMAWRDASIADRAS